MSEPILSQDEIKDLMNQPANPEGVSGYYQGEAKPFDIFGAAIQKDEKIQLLTKLHSSTVPALSRALSKSCESEIELEFLKHELGNGSEYAKTITSDKTLLVTWQDARMGLEGFFTIDRAAFFRLYGFLYGSRRPYERAGALTGLERNVLERILNPVSDVLTTAWKRSGGWQFHLKEVVDEQDKMAIFLTWNFECVRALFKLRAGEEELGQLVALFPRDIMKGMETQGAVKEEGEGASRDHYWAEAVEYCIRDKSLPVSARLGTVRLPLRSVLSLKQGDLHELLVPSKGHLLFINGKPIFRTAIGTVEGNRAVQITGRDQGASDGR